MDEASPHAGVQCNQSVELPPGGCFGLVEGPLGQKCGPLPASTATPRRRQQRGVSKKCHMRDSDILECSLRHTIYSITQIGNTKDCVIQLRIAETQARRPPVQIARQPSAADPAMQWAAVQ